MSSRILLSVLLLSVAVSPLAAKSIVTAPAPPAPAPAPPPPPPPPAEAAIPASAELKALFKASDEAQLRRNPIFALFRGDTRFGGQFGDFISDQYLAGEKAAAEADLAALKKIDRSMLNADDRISYDVFKYQTEMGLKGFEPALLKATIERPIDHFGGFQVFIPDVASGEGAAPFKTVADYDNNLERLSGYIVYLDRAIGRMKQGLADGVTNPRLVMQNVVGQFDNLLPAKVEDSVFYKPVLKFPATFSDADKTRLTTAYAAFIRDKLNPAQARVRDFIKTEYLPKARETVGLARCPAARRCTATSSSRPRRRR